MRKFRKPPKEVSERMRRVRSSGTGLESALEHILKTVRVRFERQPDVLGHPDFRIRGTKILLFCDSSFWHGRRPAERSGRAFRANRALWAEKLSYNRRRDNLNSRKLRAAGWSVQRFWDTDILGNPSKVEGRLRRILSSEAKSSANRDRPILRSRGTLPRAAARRA